MANVVEMIKKLKDEIQELSEELIEERRERNPVYWLENQLAVKRDLLQNLEKQVNN